MTSVTPEIQTAQRDSTTAQRDRTIGQPKKDSATEDSTTEAAASDEGVKEAEEGETEISENDESMEPATVWKPTMVVDRGFNSKGWIEHSGGFCHHYTDDSQLCIASSVCPCIVAGINASQLQEDLEHDPRWVLEVSAMYCLNPCSVGSAIREEIWKQATTAGGQRPGSLTHKRSFFSKARFFCLPHCCCCGGCCCAVAQDRRALLNAFKAVDQTKKYVPNFSMGNSTAAAATATGNSKSE